MLKQMTELMSCLRISAEKPVWNGVYWFVVFSSGKALNQSGNNLRHCGSVYNQKSWKKPLLPQCVYVCVCVSACVIGEGVCVCVPWIHEVMEGEGVGGVDGVGCNLSLEWKSTAVCSIGGDFSVEYTSWPIRGQKNTMIDSCAQRHDKPTVKLWV